jgi:hypothetical protein
MHLRTVVKETGNEVRTRLLNDASMPRPRLEPGISKTKVRNITAEAIFPGPNH